MKKRVSLAVGEKHSGNVIERSLVKGKSNQLADLYKYVENIQNQISASSSAVYVIQRDKVIGEWYSGIRHEEDQKAQEELRFNVHSVRKSYIGLATAIALHDGKIASLDDSVSIYLKGANEEIDSDIKIRHLITHTHGLQFTNERLTRQFSPGTSWDYNGAGLSLLYKIIRKTTGFTVNEILEDKVFKPLKFRETGWETRYKDNLVYDVFETMQEPSLTLDDNTGNERNLYVSARELAHWGYLHLRRGNIQGDQVLPSELFDLTTSIQTPKDLINTLQNGFFWFRNQNGFSQSEIGEDVPPKAYQILGSSGCTCLVIPEYDAVAVRMYNKIGNPPNYDYLRDIKNFGNLVTSLIK